MSHPPSPSTGPPAVSLDTDVVLRDGSTVHVSTVQPEDEVRLFDFFRGLSVDSRASRFFGSVTERTLRQQAERLSRLEAPEGVGLIATLGPDARIVGHAMYGLSADGSAEVAFAVADECQGQGLGTILLGQLAQIAAARGVSLFRATVLPQNHRMLDVFQQSGFDVRTRAQPGEIEVELPTELSEDAFERFEERDWTAAVNAVRPFFEPRSVAVIGASRSRGTIGGEVVHNLLSYGFSGPVLPVNPSAAVVQSVVAYPNVLNAPGPVDLAVVIVPAKVVARVADECGRKGVRALVVISAGFAEIGDAGRARQQELLRICRSAGMRLIGPNCMGLLNTHADVRMNATFAPAPPPAGRIAFMPQSGALGLAIMDYANALGIGLSTFVSVGNKADISGNDLIRYWDQDPDTDVILLYLESFGNPRKFSRIARRVARTKPIVAVKSGRSPAGARATGSHTGALIAASDVTVDALFRQAGVIRTDTLEEMFDVAALLGHQRPPEGRRVAILTNAGGPGILCADTCEAEGLEIPVPSEETQARLRAVVAAEASVTNPVDMIASAGAEQYRAAIEILGRDPGIDAIVTIFVPPLVTRPDDVARAIVEGTRTLGGGKPVLSVFMQTRGVPEALRSADVRIPSYAFPEDAAIALARIARYGEWLAREPEPPSRFDDVRHSEAVAILAAALGREQEWLSPDEVSAMLSCYGLPVLKQIVASTPAEAAARAAELGPRVALKAIAPGLVHKTDEGAVRLSLAPDQVEEAAREIDRRLRDAGLQATGFLVQEMAPEGVEMILGVAHDSQFGPVVACGAGGVLVELLNDVAVRLTPLSERDAREMIGELRTAPLLGGYRGRPAVDVDALVDAILRIATLVEELPQIAELDLNPLIVHERGATIVDARVRIAPAEDAPLVGTRR